VYHLNLGGAFVRFSDAPPEEATWLLKIKLPAEGPITVKAETLYHDAGGIAVRFVDVDETSAIRLMRTVAALTPTPAQSHASAL
jgi:hypothetical protein